MARLIAPNYDSRDARRNPLKEARERSSSIIEARERRQCRVSLSARPRARGTAAAGRALSRLRFLYFFFIIFFQQADETQIGAERNESECRGYDGKMTNRRKTSKGI